MSLKTVNTFLYLSYLVSYLGRGILWNSGRTIFISCQILQGEYYNADEVQAMVAAEMLEEKRKKQEEEDMFDDIGAVAGQVDRNCCRKSDL